MPDTSPTSRDGSAEPASAHDAVLSRDAVAEAFEAQRDRLRAVAHRMLGSHADAEDVVQEAWLRLTRQDPATVDNLAGWLTTVVGRISLDVLRSRRTRPELTYDDRLPDLVVTADDGDGVATPEDDAALADSVGLALLVVLDRLGPSERLAFVLHDLFGVPFTQIGQILGRSADAAKMLASRARRKVQSGDEAAGDEATAAASGTGQRRVVQAFLAASRDGDFEALLRVLDPEVRVTAHTPGGVVVVLGATKVVANARLGAGGAAGGRPVLVNGLPGVLAWREDGTPLALLAFTIVGGRISAITAVSDPAALAALDLPGRE